MTRRFLRDAPEVAFPEIVRAHGFLISGSDRPSKTSGCCDQVPSTSRSKRGLPRSGAKLGSILSQPGER